MLVGQSVVVIVDEATKVGRPAAELSGWPRQLGFDETRQGKAALVVTEAASNLLKHAGGGELILQGLDYGPAGAGLEILALDSGRGMSDVGRCLADGYSTAGSPGTGLGAISRLADSFRDLLQSGAWDGSLGSPRSNAASSSCSANPTLELGVVRVSAPGEEVCGDDWATIERDGRTLRPDGRRAGARAAGGRGRGRRPCASSAAIGRSGAGRDRRVDRTWPCESTRGAALAIARLDPVAARGPLCRRGQYLRRDPRHDDRRNARAWSRRTAPSGTRFARSKLIDYPWTEDSLLLMHSDGLATHWNLDRYPGLAAEAPEP